MKYLCAIKVVSKFQITNWTPVYYNNSSELPADMPENLKQAIKGYYSTYRNLVSLLINVIVTMLRPPVQVWRQTD